MKYILSLGGTFILLFGILIVLLNGGKPYRERKSMQGAYLIIVIGAVLIWLSQKV